VRFCDFLRATVLMSAGSATALAAVSVAGASADGNSRLVYFGLGWWLAAAAIGAVLGRRSEPNPAIARLLASARTARALPDTQPRTVLLNRLWPLLLSTISAGALAFLVPQAATIAAGFAIIWALSWRRQEGAVAAIEERDGVRFYVERTSPVGPMTLVRTAGFGGRFLDVNGSREQPPRRLRVR